MLLTAVPRIYWGALLGDNSCVQRSRASCVPEKPQCSDENHCSSLWIRKIISLSFHKTESHGFAHSSSCVCHIMNCIKIHTHTCIHKSQALPSKHLQFKPTKQTLLFTVTATYLSPEMGQAVFWRSLPYRLPAHTAESIPLARVWLQVPRLPGKGEEKPGNPAGAATCPTAQHPAPGLGKLKLYWKARGEGRALSAAMGETKGVHGI